jgi:hypothetical protein
LIPRKVRQLSGSIALTPVYHVPCIEIFFVNIINEYPSIGDAPVHQDHEDMKSLSEFFEVISPAVPKNGLKRIVMPRPGCLSGNEVAIRVPDERRSVAGKK